MILNKDDVAVLTSQIEHLKMVLTDLIVLAPGIKKLANTSMHIVLEKYDLLKQCHADKHDLMEKLSIDTIRVELRTIKVVVLTVDTIKCPDFVRAVIQQCDTILKLLDERRGWKKTPPD